MGGEGFSLLFFLAVTHFDLTTHSTSLFSHLPPCFSMFLLFNLQSTNYPHTPKIVKNIEVERILWLSLRSYHMSNHVFNELIKGFKGDGCGWMYWKGNYKINCNNEQVNKKYGMISCFFLRRRDMVCRTFH